MTEIIVLSDQDVERLVSLHECIPLVEKAFAEYDRGESFVFPVVREPIRKYDGVFGIKSGYLENQDVLGFKAGGFWANNRSAGLPSHQSVILLFDPRTGRPTALVAANYVTQVRTAAIGAIGCKYLARQDSTVLALIGCGQQGRNQLNAALEVLPNIREVRLYDRIPSSSSELAEQSLRRPQQVTAVDSPEKACLGADVIITAASSYSAIIMDDWIKPGTHINAIGTDTRGKQELDPRIFSRAKAVADHIGQSIYLGECQHAYDGGILPKESVIELGEVINGSKPGRESAEEITVFATPGVTIQDLATAGYALEKAVALSVGGKITV